jgi:hypothetical protein
MEKQKQNWHSVGLPDSLFKRIRKVAVWAGYTSISEYVRHAVLMKLQKDETSWEDEKELQREIGERLDR